jgi:hypothetical protein
MDYVWSIFSLFSSKLDIFIADLLQLRWTSPHVEEEKEIGRLPISCINTSRWSN